MHMMARKWAFDSQDVYRDRYASLLETESIEGSMS
jgi:hypothetical protein